MDAKQRRNDWTVRVAAWIAASIAFPVLYLLSFGPALWLRQHGLIPVQLGVFFLPILWMCQRFPALRDAMDAYLRLFSP